MLQKIHSLVFLLMCSNSTAAPLPLMSSLLVTSKSNHLLRDRGYVLDLDNSAWRLNQTKWNQSLDQRAAEELKTDTIALHELTDEISLESTLNQKLSINVQNLKKSSSLDAFTQRHIKEYGQFGFELLGNKKVSLGSKNLVLIDLFHRAQNKSVRQAIVGNNQGPTSNRIAVISCEFMTKDQSTEAAASIKNCNDVIQKFSFADEHSSPE